MEIETCSNRECGKKFELQEMGGQMPGTKEPEDIRCPYCGHTIQRMTNGMWQTHKLRDDPDAKT